MTINTKKTAPTKVLMLMAKHCAYCGPMMLQLTELMKSGHISRLEFINIEKEPALALELGVRSVPWLQVGPFELAGARDKDELALWLKRASSSEGMAEYFEEVLAEGKIDYVEKMIKKHPESLRNIIELMADPEAKINVRLGVGVIIEGVAETVEFKQLVPILIRYLSNSDARVRSDACHYLSLTNDVAHINVIENLLTDESEEVREIAQESLDDLRGYD